MKRGAEPIDDDGHTKKRVKLLNIKTKPKPLINEPQLDKKKSTNDEGPTKKRVKLLNIKTRPKPLINEPQLDKKKSTNEEDRLKEMISPLKSYISQNQGQNFEQSMLKILNQNGNSSKLLEDDIPDIPISHTKLVALNSSDPLTDKSQETAANLLDFEPISLNTKKTIIINDVSSINTSNTNVQIFKHVDSSNNNTNTSIISEKIRKQIKDKIPLVSSVSNKLKSKPDHIDSLIGIWERINQDYFDESDKNTSSRSILQPTEEELLESIVATPRSYIVESFYREPIAKLGERPCVMGDLCQSVYLCKNYIANNGSKKKPPIFVIREFLVPKEIDARTKLRATNPDKNPLVLINTHFPNVNKCILCERRYTHSYSILVGSKIEKVSIKTVQKHQNLFNIHGEYDKSVMMTTGPRFSGTPFPIVRFCVSDYIIGQYDVFSFQYKSKPSLFKKITKSKSDTIDPTNEKEGNFFEEESGSIDFRSVSTTEEEYCTNLDIEMRKSQENERDITELYDKIKKSKPESEENDDEEEIIERTVVNGWYESSIMVYNQENEQSIDSNSVLNQRDLGREWSEIKKGPYIGDFLFTTLGLLDPSDESEFTHLGMSKKMYFDESWYITMIPFYTMYLNERKDSALKMNSWEELAEHYDCFYYSPISSNLLNYKFKKSYLTIVDNVLLLMPDSFSFSLKYYIEKNSPRFIFNQSIAYEDIVVKKGTNGEISNNNNAMYSNPSTNYSKLIEACVVPAQNKRMQFTFSPLLNNPNIIIKKLRRDGTRTFPEHDDTCKKYFKNEYSRLNPWNLYSIVKSLVIQTHLIIEFFDECIMKWEDLYENCKNLKSIYYNPITDKHWLNRYDIFTKNPGNGHEFQEKTVNSINKDCNNKSKNPKIYPFSPYNFEVTHFKKNKSIHDCVYVIKNILGDLFMPFDELYNEFVYMKRQNENSIRRTKVIDKNSRVYKWISQINLVENEQILKDITIPNTKFKEIALKIVNSGDNMIVTHSTFLTFLYSICFLQKYTEPMRIYIQSITNDILQHFRDKSAAFSVIRGLKNNNEERALYYNCHIYLSCFLPMAKWFNKNDKIDDSIVPFYVLFPYPTLSSINWTKTSDTLYSLNNINFWSGTGMMDGRAVSSGKKKSLPFRSQGRSVDRKVKHSSQMNVCYGKYFYKQIQNTLYGTYPNIFVPNDGDGTLNLNGSEKRITIGGSIIELEPYNFIPLLYRPSFGTMLAYYSNVFTLENYNKILEWGTSESKLCSIIIKDLLISMMVLQPQYIDVQTVLDWKNLWYKNIIMTNILRIKTDQSLITLYNQNKSYSIDDLLPKFDRSQISLYTSITCFLKQTPKQSFSLRLYDQFKIFNESLIIRNIIFEENIKILTAKLAKDPQNNDLLSKLEEKKSMLAKSQFELSDKAKEEIWSAIFGIQYEGRLISDKQIEEHGIFNFITEEEGMILYKLNDLYNRNVSPKEIYKFLPNFTIVGFKTLFFVLKVIKLLQNVELVKLDPGFASKIHQAMLKKYNIVSNGSPIMVDGKSMELNNKAYHIQYAPCCKRICNLNEKVRNFGSEAVIYDPYKQIYICGKKKLKKNQNFDLKFLVNNIQLEMAKESMALKDNNNIELNCHKDMTIDDDEWADLSISQMAIKQLINSKEDFGNIGCFEHLLPKAQRKVARAIDRQNQLYCPHHPELITINLKGYAVIEGKHKDKRRKLIHCPKCADLHSYNEMYWRGEDYFCSICWTEEETYYAKCIYCNWVNLRKPDQISSLTNITLSTTQLNANKGIKKKKNKNKCEVDSTIADDADNTFLTANLYEHFDNDEDVNELLVKSIKIDNGTSEQQSLFKSSGTYVDNGDIVSTIYQQEAKFRKEQKSNSSSSKSSNGFINYYNPNDNFSNKRSNSSNLQDDYDCDELQESYDLKDDEITVDNVIDIESEISSILDVDFENNKTTLPISDNNNGGGGIVSNKKKRKRRSTRKKHLKKKNILVTPSMVTSKGINKVYMNKYEEVSQKHVERENVIANRGEREKLIERIQRYFRKNGRIIYFKSKKTDKNVFIKDENIKFNDEKLPIVANIVGYYNIFHVASLCDSHHNNYIQKQEYITNRLQGPNGTNYTTNTKFVNFLLENGVHCLEDLYEMLLVKKI